MAPAYDPAGDMNLALLGNTGALLGAFMLAGLVIVNHPVLMGAGTAVAVGGAVTSLMILVTSDRGRKPAKPFLSLMLGLVLAILVSTASMSGYVVGVKAYELMGQIEFASQTQGPIGQSTGLSSVLMDGDSPDSPDDDVPVIDGDVVAGDDDDDDAVADNATKPAPTTAAPRPGPRPSPSPSPRPSPSPSASPSPSPSPAPRPAPAPAPAPSTQLQAVPLEVIDTILRNNMDVKRCFFTVYQSTGSLPPRVDVKFQLQASGSVTGVSVKQTEWNGTDLERCLQTAVTAIAFPPAQKGQAMTYPFILQ